MSASEHLDKGDFEFLQKLIYKETGIVIDDHKKEMVFRRVSKRMHNLSIDCVSAYCDILRDKNIEEMNNFINAITTNLTSFFRENHHFDFLKNDFLKLFNQSGNKRLRVWSSACSTGEEPYSIAITLREAFLEIFDKLDAKILATDLDTQVIKTAINGIYAKDKIKHLDDKMKLKWFESLDGIQYQVSDSLKSIITFNKLNLLGTWPFKGKFDVIFCRNVLIYFDKPTQKILVDRFYNTLNDNGILILGHSESILKGNDNFHNLGKTIYQKKEVK